MINQCGRVEPIIQTFVMFKFVGMKEAEKFGLKDWKQCSETAVEGKSTCPKHLATPLKFKVGETIGSDSKSVDVYEPITEEMIAKLVVKK